MPLLHSQAINVCVAGRLLQMKADTQLIGGSMVYIDWFDDESSISRPLVCQYPGGTMFRSFYSAVFTW